MGNRLRCDVIVNNTKPKMYMKGRTVEEIQEQEFIEGLMLEVRNMLVNRLIKFLSGKVVRI